MPVPVVFLVELTRSFTHRRLFGGDVGVSLDEEETFFMLSDGLAPGEWGVGGLTVVVVLEVKHMQLR